MKQLLLFALLLSACGQVDQPDPVWEEAAVIRLASIDDCWRIDGPNRATSTLDTRAEDVTPGPKVWPGGAEVLVWTSDGETGVDGLSHQVVECR